MHKIKILQNNVPMDITHVAGNITLSSSIDTLGSSFSFEIARNYGNTDYFISEAVQVGDIVKFINGAKEIFTGVIVEIETSKFKRSIKCLDFYFYLNKNKIIKQFNEINASSAIKQLLVELGIETGEFENIPTLITKIYKKNTVAEIIKDILEKVNNERGEKYILEIEGMKFNLIKYKKIEAKLGYNFLGTTTLNESIIDMKNSIIVTSNEQEDEEILESARDEESIKKYGLLQEVIEIDPDADDTAKVKNVAEKKLKELNKVFKRASIKVYGNDELKAGRILEVKNDEYKLRGKYLIKSCSHTYQKEHLTDLELEVADD